MENIFDSIDDYLLGALTQTDKQAFEKSMANDPDLAAAVAVHQLEYRAGQLVLRDDLKAQMATWRVEKEARQAAEAASISPLTVVGKKAKIVPMRRRIFQYASAAVILLAIGFMARWAMQPQALSGVGITQKFYDEPSFGTKSGADTSLITAAERLVEVQKDYKLALLTLQKIKDTALIGRKLALKAHCEYKMGDFQAAATTLQMFIDATNDPLSKQPAEWHWLLMKVAANQRDAAFETLLQRIENDDKHQFQDDAKKLREALK